MDVKSSSLTGAAGEHLVMSRLLSRGYIAALAPQGVVNFDIVVTSRDGAHQCAFQVKTSWEKGSDRGWHMSEKHEKLVDDRIFYAFVDLGRLPSPSSGMVDPIVYVLPSAKVAEAISTSYQAWLDRGGKNGKPLNRTTFRRLNLDYSKICGPEFHLKKGWLDEYKENWDQISRFAGDPFKPTAEA